MTRVIIPPKRQEETRWLPPQGFDFSDRLAPDETIQAALITCRVYSGNDDSPQEMIWGNETGSGPVVMQLVTGGVVGTIYELVCRVATSTGQTLELAGFLAVIPNEEGVMHRMGVPSSSIVGTTTNDNAPPGFIGEYLTATSPDNFQIGPNLVPTNVTSLALTPGDWDVGGACYFSPAAVTGAAMIAALSSVSATMPLQVSRWAQFGGEWVNYAAAISMTLPQQRFSLANSATVFLVAEGRYTAGTIGCYGYIWARRAR